MAKSLHDVINWWSIRLTAGCQLSDMERFIEKLDYKPGAGSIRWLRAVKIEALYQDFSLGRGEISLTQFAMYAKPLVQPKTTKLMFSKLPRLDGRAANKQLKNFWLFRSLESHVRAFDAALEAMPVLTSREPPASVLELPRHKNMREADWLNQLLSK